VLYVRDIVVGVPILSSYGFLGWSSISLIHDTVSSEYILLDSGGFNNRLILLKKLSDLGIEPSNISKILLTHLHFDHCMNLELFPHAVVYINEKELKYFLSNEYQRRNDLFIPKPYLEKIIEKRKIVEISEGMEPHPDIVAIELPGHTPGSTGYLIEHTKIIFVGDAVKNLYELMHKKPTLYFGSLSQWKKSIDKVLKISKEIIPGHGSRIKVENEKIKEIIEKLEIEFEIVIKNSKRKFKLSTLGELIIKPNS